MQWQLREFNPILKDRIASGLNISPILSQILVNRGIDSPEKAFYFLYGQLENTPSPFIFKDMEKTTHYLKNLILEKKPLYIVGDKDVDGMTGAAIFYSFFKQAGLSSVYWSLPTKEEPYGFSERLYQEILSTPKLDTVITVDCGIKEQDFIDKLNQNQVKTIITDHHTPDKALPEAFSIINPHLEEPYRMDYLSGAAVALKVVQGLYFSFHEFYNKPMLFIYQNPSGGFFALYALNFVPQEGDLFFSSLKELKTWLKEFQSLVVVGLTQDIGLLKKELSSFSHLLYFDIQKLGKIKGQFKKEPALKELCSYFTVFYEPKKPHKLLFSLAKSLFFKYSLPIYEKLSLMLQYATLGTVCDYVPLNSVENHIMVKNGLASLNQDLPFYIRLLTSHKDQIDMRDIGFSIGPVLNSGGRLGQSDKSFQFLIQKETEELEAIFTQLKSLNNERKKIGDTGFKEALSAIELSQTKENVLFYASSNIIQGITGIIANRISQHFQKPSFVFYLNPEKEEVVGSGRSFLELDILLILDSCQGLLNRFGGHKRACGMSFDFDKLEEVMALIKESANKYFPNQNQKPCFYYDVQIHPQDLSLKLCQEIKALNPFGPENEKPVFFSTGLTPYDVKIIGNNQKHIKFKVKENPYIDFLGWNMAEKEELLNSSLVDVYYSFEENIYNGRVGLQSIILELKKSL